MSKSSDDRMYWIREMDHAIDRSNSMTRTEIEFSSDSRINGVLDFSDHRVVCQMSTFEPDTSGLLRYTLVLQRPPFDPAEYLGGDASPQGYFFNGGPGAELVAIFSLVLQCRLFIHSVTSEWAANNTVPLRHYFDVHPNPSGYAFDKALKTDRNFGIALPEFLDDLRRVNAVHHPAFALAIYNYSEALRLLGTDEELAYVRLVSAVECVSKSFTLSEEDDCFKGRRFDEFVKAEALTDTQNSELRNIFNVRKSRLKFLRFMEKYGTAGLPEEDDRPDHVALNRSNFSRTLNAIYRARSGYLHQAEPMYTSHVTLNNLEWDFSPDLGKQYDRKKFLAEDKLPFGRVFQRIVRYAILECVRELASSS